MLSTPERDRSIGVLCLNLITQLVISYTLEDDMHISNLSQISTEARCGYYCKIYLSAFVEL